MSLTQWIKNLFASRPRPAARGAVAGSPGKLPGRNERCWCGSGKKYKQCHFRKDLEERVEAQHAAYFAKKTAAAAGAGAAGVTRARGPKVKAAAPAEHREWKGGKAK